MNRQVLGLALAALILMPLSAGAADMAGHMAASGSKKNTTIKGELVGMGCYLDHGARGAKHADCATRCIDNGMPMGVLTDAGDLYLLTVDHENADPYNELKKMAAKTVIVIGPVIERNGMKGIDVKEAKLAAAK